MIGRTSDFKTTILTKGIGQPGDLVKVKIVGATSHTLFMRVYDRQYTGSDPWIRRIDPSELKIVDHRVFQRLRGIKQLGFMTRLFQGRLIRATHCWSRT